MLAIRIRNKLSAAILSLALLFAATTSANAQSFGYRGNRLSGGEKAAIIGGSAAAGALIGGLLGGKKGAVIGGLVGAGGGTAYSLSRNDDDRYRRYYRGRDYRYYRDNRFFARNRRIDNDRWFYNNRWNDRWWDGYRWRYRR